MSRDGGTVWNNTNFQLFFKKVRNTMLVWWSISVYHAKRVPMTSQDANLAPNHLIPGQVYENAFCARKSITYGHLDITQCSTTLIPKFMQIEHIHWQWKQIASEKSFHSISLFVNERICFPSLIVSRVDFPLEMPFYMDWPWEEIFGNWGYIYGSNDGFFDKRFPYQRGFICRKKPINESLSTSRRDSNDPG